MAFQVRLIQVKYGIGILLGVTITLRRAGDNMDDRIRCSLDSQMVILSHWFIVTFLIEIKFMVNLF